jgi:VIT1/CCC1 family predicted Fe2+/Mn2+ transporter
LEAKERELLISIQRNEITEHHVYKYLVKRMKGKNGEVLEKIAQDELRHYNLWKEITGEEVKPSLWRVFFYILVAYILGLTFAIKIMERGEEAAEAYYESLGEKYPQARTIAQDEFEHEKILIDMIEEERLKYVGSMVLGLNDALVELTGSLAGLTFALQNTRVVGMAGLIMGIAASLSMSASEYLSRKAEADGATAVKGAFYTGVAYVITVVLLVVPFFVFSHYLLALVVTLVNVVLIIYVFTYFIAVVKGG